MSTILKLVQGDTLPQIFVSLTDEQTGLPINLTSVTSIVMQFYTVTGVLVDTLTGTPLTGLLECDFSINNGAAYSVAGSGGRVAFSLNANTLANPGQYEGQIVITFASGQVQTVWSPIQFSVRPTL